MTLQIEEIKLDYKSEKIYVGDSIDVSIVSDNQDIEYAWYVMNGKERVEIKWYKKDQQSITYTFSTPGNYRFIGYIKDKGNNKKSLVSKSLKVEKLQLKNLENVTTTETGFESIKLNEIEPIIYTIKTKNLRYDFLLKRDPNSTCLTVLGPAASSLPPPVFNRFTWMNEIPGNVLYYSDPTWHLTEIRTGYGLGLPKEYALEKIAEFIQQFSRKLKVPNHKIILFGTSAGGFMSLMLGGMIKKSTVIVNNPVTACWRSAYFKVLIKILNKEIAEYNKLNVDKMKELFMRRLDVSSYYEESTHVPKIRYLLNTASKGDVENSYLPFIEKYHELMRVNRVNDLITHYYWDNEAQHNPVSKADTLNYIKETQSFLEFNDR